MKNNNQIGQELSEFKPVELVDCEDEEAGSSYPFGTGRFTHPEFLVVHFVKKVIERGKSSYDL